MSINFYEIGRLEVEIKVVLNVRYMQIKNVDIEDGFVNGVIGIIVKLDILLFNLLNGILYVKFDDVNIGC